MSILAAAARLSTTRADARYLLPVALHLCIVLPLAVILNIGQDDAYTMHTTSRGLAYAFQQSIGFELNAPLYFLVMALWRSVDASAFFATLFSIVCTTCTLLVVPKLLERYVPAVPARWVVLAVAVNPFFIWVALEIRVYTLAVLLSALLMLAFYDAFLREDGRAVNLLTYGALIVASGYSEYYLLVLVAAQGITVAVYRSARLLKFCASVLVAGLAIAPMASLVSRQAGQTSDGLTPYRSVAGALKAVAQIVASYVVPVRGWPHSHVLYAVVAAVFAVLFFLNIRKIERKRNLIVVLQTVVAIVAVTVLVYVAQVSLATRHAAPLLLPAIFSLYALIALFKEPTRRRGALIWTCATVLFSIVSLFITYGALAKPGDWIRAATYIQSREHPGEPIIVFQAENAVPFAYYYRGPNVIVAIPHPVDFHRYDVRQFVLHDAAQIDSVLSKVPHGRRFWLIKAGGCNFATLHYGCDVLERYVRSRFITESAKELYGSEVRSLVLKANRQTLR